MTEKKCTRIIRSINRREQIPSLFDSPPEFVDGRSFKYKGEIMGIQATIKFTDDCEYYIQTRRFANLAVVYNEVLNRLFQTPPNLNGKSLADIVRRKQV
jgi:hypothetical protein